MNILPYFKEVLKYSIIFAGIQQCVFEHIGDFVVCNGPSMEPTLYTKDILVTERISKRYYNYQKGDIIIAISPLNPNVFICKRICGVPGDTIISNTSQNIEKSEVSNFMTGNVVPRGYVWIEGDNTYNSSDSRYYGPIPMGLIKSRVIFRIWPISSIKKLYNIE